jgi:hypothetical protein
MPTPYVPADDFSGRVTLRLPKSLHRALTEAAEEERISLNQHLVNILTYYSGFAAATRETAPWHPSGQVAKPARGGKPRLRIVYSSNLEEAVSW